VTLPISKESFSPSQRDESHKVDVNVARSAILDLALRMRKDEVVEGNPVSDLADEDSYKVLIVEDNVELLMLMHQLLSQKYHVHTASNGQEALEIIQCEELDLVISDVMMPVMDGYELTKQVKNNPNYSHLPIILLTAKTQEEDRSEALLIGADDYITKPFKIGDLELRINNIIENRKRIQREFMEKTAEQTQQQLNVTDDAEMTADQLFLKRAIDFVYQHLDDAEYDRDTFAMDMGASASTLYNKLRSLTGLSVRNFIRDIRLKEAMRIAQQQPDIRVSDLAYKVGFQDPKYFSTCFKKQFGVQPKEFMETL
jgi:DNA-binding response OmpR family regulator